MSAIFHYQHEVYKAWWKRSAERFQEYRMRHSKDAEPVPAVSPNCSVHANHIICLEDGKPFKSLKRHLIKSYGLTPDEYCDRWGSKPDYPTTAPDYSERRSALVRQLHYILGDR